MRLTPTLLLFAAVAAAGEEKSAFLFPKDKDVRHSINLDEVKAGTRKKDPRDAIPAIKKPKHAPAGEAPWVLDEMRVIGLSINGEARAYPLYILETHELVDDVLVVVDEISCSAHGALRIISRDAVRDTDAVAGHAGQRTQPSATPSVT